MTEHNRIEKAEQILHRLTCGALPEIQVFSTLDSTNTYLKEKARDGAPAGTLVLAMHQSAGRGRVGRSFFSPEGTGLYMSLLLRPDIPFSDALKITTCAAVTVAKAVETLTDAPSEIKWVNDIYVGGKKVCGILTESAYKMSTGGLDFAVLGIGVDVFSPRGGFGELSSIAGSLYPYHDDCEYMQKVILELASKIVNYFMERYPHISDNGFYEEYKRRLFILDKEVYVVRGQEQIPAVAYDLGKDYSLRVRYSDGTEESLTSGEISVKPITYSKFTD